jgi:hypothetical protein
MKTLYFSLAFLFFASVTSGQVLLNRSNHQYSENSQPVLVNIGNDLFFTTVNNDAKFYGGANLYKYDLSGNLVFRKNVGNGEPVCGFRSLDNKLVIASGVELNCD